MTQQQLPLPPRWFFAILTVGGLVTCGVYLGLLHAGLNTPGNIVRAVAFGIFGLLMLWGVLGRPAR